jgi:hypothetical protein
MELLPKELFNACMHIVFMTIIKIYGMLFSNQSGRFPITSCRGNKYIVIFYSYDDNFNDSVIIKSWSKEELLRAYQLVYAYLTARGFRPLTRLTSRRLTTSNPSFTKRTHASSTLRPTSTAPIQRIGKVVRGRITPSLLGITYPSPMKPVSGTPPLPIT